MQEGSYAGDQRCGPEGFGDIVVGTQIQADDRIGLLSAGRQHNDGNFRGIRSGPHMLADVESICSGQHQVADDQVLLLSFYFLQGPDFAHGRDRTKAFLL